MERGHDGRHESGRRVGGVGVSSASKVYPASGGRMGEQSPSPDGMRRWRTTQAESIRAGAAQANGVVSRAGALSAGGRATWARSMNE
jgi:hypothetical protein